MLPFQRGLTLGCLADIRKGSTEGWGFKQLLRFFPFSSFGWCPIFTLTDNDKLFDCVLALCFELIFGFQAVLVRQGRARGEQYFSAILLVSAVVVEPDAKCAIVVVLRSATAKPKTKQGCCGGNGKLSRVKRRFHSDEAESGE